MTTSYSQLKTDVADFLNRDDLTSIIPTFILLAEAQINRVVRHWRMEQRATVSDVADGRVQVPSDWVETVMISRLGTYKPLQLISRMGLAKMREASNDTGGNPEYYVMEDGYFHLYPAPSDADIELLYMQKIPALSDSNTTNWLLDDHPDVYLYGTLMQSAPYLKDDNRTQVWASLYRAGWEAANKESDRSRHSGSGLKLRINTYG